MKVLGLDYGRKKVGLAVGDTETKLAEPLMTVNNFQFSILRQAQDKFFNFQSILNDQIFKKIVIGITGGAIDKEIRIFGDRLEKQSGVKVEYFDETLSTQDAQKALIASGRKRKNRQKKEDSVAAAIMLENYLNSF